MDEIALQIQHCLYRIRLATPNFATWSGPAAITLEGVLRSLETELTYLSLRFGDR